MLIWLELHHPNGAIVLVNMNQVQRITWNSSTEADGSVLHFGANDEDEYIIVSETYSDIHTRLGRAGAKP